MRSSGCYRCLILLLHFYIIARNHTIASPLHGEVAPLQKCNVFEEYGDGTLEFQTKSYTNVSIVRFQNEGYNRLFCSAYNYCHIQWYRNDRPYPWNFEITDEDDVNLKDNNQTLVFERIFCDAEGSYTCVVSNATHQIERKFQMIANMRHNQPGEGNPLLITGDECHNRTVCIGDYILFDCRFYVDVEDFDYDLTWYFQKKEKFQLVEWLVDTNNTSIEYIIGRRSVPVSDDKCHDSTEIFSGTLQFNVSNEEAYGVYIAWASVKQHQTSVYLHVRPGVCEPKQKNNMLASFLVLAFVLCTLILTVSLGKAVSLDVKVWYKDSFGAAEYNDGKKYDVYISYNNASQDDRIFAVQTLRHHLITKYGYSVCVPDINILPGTHLIEEIFHALEMSRRCVLVVSPSYISHLIASSELDIAMDTMSATTSSIIPVVFQEVTKEEVARSDMLKYVMKSHIKWNPCHKRRVFKELLLRLPPRSKNKLGNLVIQEVLPNGFTAQLSQTDERTNRKNKFEYVAGAVIKDYIDNSYPETERVTTI